MFYLKDPTTKEPSPTLTLMVGGAGAVVLKWFIAGMTIGSFSIAPVNGIECAALVAPFLALYGHRRTMAKKRTEQSDVPGRNRLRRRL